MNYFFIFERGNKAISGENTRGPISPKIRKGESATFMREKTFQSNLYSGFIHFLLRRVLLTHFSNNPFHIYIMGEFKRI